MSNYLTSLEEKVRDAILHDLETPDNNPFSTSSPDQPRPDTDTKKVLYDIYTEMEAAPDGSDDRNFWGSRTTIVNACYKNVWNVRDPSEQSRILERIIVKEGITPPPVAPVPATAVPAPVVPTAAPAPVVAPPPPAIVAPATRVATVPRASSVTTTVIRSTGSSITLAEAQWELSEDIINFYHTFDEERHPFWSTPETYSTVGNWVETNRGGGIDLKFQALSNRLNEEEADRVAFAEFYDQALNAGYSRFRAEQRETSYADFQLFTSGLNFVSPADPFTPIVQPLAPLVSLKWGFIPVVPRSYPFSFEELSSPRAAQNDVLNMAALGIGTIPPLSNGVRSITGTNDSDQLELYTARAQMHFGINQRSLLFAGAPNRPWPESLASFATKWANRFALGQLAYDRRMDIQIHADASTYIRDYEKIDQTDTLCTLNGNVYDASRSTCVRDTPECVDSEGHMIGDEEECKVMDEENCNGIQGGWDSTTQTCEVYTDTLFETSNDAIEAGLHGSLSYRGYMAAISANVESRTLDAMRLGYDTLGRWGALGFGLLQGVYDAVVQPHLDLSIRSSLIMPEGMPEEDSLYQLKSKGGVNKSLSYSVDVEAARKGFVQDSRLAAVCGTAGALGSFGWSDKNAGAVDRFFAYDWSDNCRTLQMTPAVVSQVAYYERNTSSNSIFVAPKSMLLGAQIAEGMTDFRRTLDLVRTNLRKPAWDDIARVVVATGFEAATYGEIAVESKKEGNTSVLEARLKGLGAGAVIYGVPELLKAVVNPTGHTARQDTWFVQNESGTGVQAALPGPGGRVVAFMAMPTVVADRDNPLAIKPAASATLDFRQNVPQNVINLRATGTISPGEQGRPDGRLLVNLTFTPRKK